METIEEVENFWCKFCATDVAEHCECERINHEVDEMKEQELQEQEEKNMNLLKQQRREIMEESMKNPPTSEIKFTVSVNGEDIKDDLSSGDEYEPENNKLNENNKQTNSSDYADINALTKISVNDRNILLMKIYMEAKKNIDRQNLIGDNEQYNKLIRDESNRLLDLYIAENS